MKVSALKCLRCGDVVFSRARHDMRFCSCGNCAIDGGFEYCKCTAEHMDRIEPIQIDLPDDITKEILWADWNNRTDKFGIIPNEE